MNLSTKLFILCLLFPIYSLANANTFIEEKINDKTVQIIDYDLSSKDYNISIWYTPDATNTRDLMIASNGVTSINGVFFCPADYGECKGKTYTINEHYVNGEKVSWIYDTTWDRVVFGWDKNKTPFLFQTDKINPTKEKDIYDGFANHPLLLKDGQNMLEYWYDSFLVDKKMKDVMTRNFICSDKDKKHIYFGLINNVTIDDTIPILLSIGCYDAINLDAGKSTAFVYNGRYIVWPQRPILDGIIIQRNGLNVRWLDTNAKNAVAEIAKKMTAMPQYIQQNFWKNITSQLNALRISIYEKNSIDLVDKDGKTNGYKIEIKDLNTLKKVYYINSLNYYISQLWKNT